MKINILLLFFTAILLTSCFDSPNFPDTPKIEFKDVIFKRVGGNSDYDSLIIRLDFEDGDGDLGLSPEEDFFPYNAKNYFSNKTGRLFDFSNEGSDDLLTLKDRAVIDSLPPFSGYFKCISWDTSPEIYPIGDSIPISDTVYFQFNKRHNNIFVDYFVKENGTFRTFDWRKEIDCSTTYDGRFPVLYDDENKNSTLEGTIRYRMLSTGFLDLFANKTLKLRIQIVDRAGNFSNIVETPEFTLNEIQVN